MRSAARHSGAPTGHRRDAGETRWRIGLIVLAGLLLDSLDPKYREALVLTDLRGMMQADAAALAGLSLPGMKSRVQRARKMLAALYHRHRDIALDGRNAPMTCDPRPGL
jgi:hypothetical protein